MIRKGVDIDNHPLEKLHVERLKQMVHARKMKKFEDQMRVE